MPDLSNSSSAFEPYGANLCASCRATGVPARTVLSVGLSGASTSSGERQIYLVALAPWTRPVQLALGALATAVVTWFTSMFVAPLV